MRTTLDLEQILFDVIKGTSIPGMIGGKVYKRLRPAASKLEDLVIVSLPVSTGDIQTAIVNVNVHVPNLKVTKNGVEDNSIPDLARLGVLATAVAGQLNERYTANPDYFYFIQQQGIIQNDIGNDHYLNFRIAFNSINL